jgi:hypothetical protein
MLKYEDYCVSCPPEMGCLGSSCPNRNVAVYYCDTCDDYAAYQLDGEDYCEECAEKYLVSLYDNPEDCEELDIYEMAEDNDIYVTKID